MITLKSNRELALMKEAGRIVAYAHRLVAQAIKDGVSTAELDKVAYKAIISQGATPSFKGYNGFPGSICASINDVVIHGIPSKKIKCKTGDIISIDIGANYKGYHGDSAKTHCVGSVSNDVVKLIEVTKASFYEGVKFAKPGNHLSDISNAIQTYVESFGYSVVKDFTGHGVGSSLHEDPAIPNYGPAGLGVLLRPGMTLAIEPMVNLGRDGTVTMSDGWTVKTVDGLPSAHYEHTIVITKDSYEILTIEEDN